MSPSELAQALPLHLQKPKYAGFRVLWNSAGSGAHLRPPYCTLFILRQDELGPDSLHSSHPDLRAIHSWPALAFGVLADHALRHRAVVALQFRSGPEAPLYLFGY